MDTQLTEQLVEQLKSKLVGLEENEQGDLQRTFEIDYGHYHEAMLEWKAEQVPGADTDLGQIVLRRPDMDTVEHYYFSERGPGGIFVERADETSWNSESKEDDRDQGEELEELVDSEEDATNILGGNSDERRPVDKADLQRLLAIVQTIEIK
jgi:hypothetical protein